MQLVQEITHSTKVRDALKELLDWGMPWDSVRTVLAALVPDPDALRATWWRLEDFHADVDGLRNRTTSPGFDDLGDGGYCDLDPESALQAAEDNLDEALEDALRTIIAVRPELVS